MTKGFVTIATGKETYFILAYNLLSSYRKFTKEPLPFAIITDKENKYTRAFDKVIILENATSSYMDKLEMLSNPPFDYNIFIDADCLAYGDLNNLLVIKEDWNGVMTFGETLPLDSDKGWFLYENLGNLQGKVKYCLKLHGGIIFFKKDIKTKQVYDTCKIIANNYYSYKFKMFIKPADEPILALSMAINGCKPIDTRGRDGACYFVFYPVAKKIKADISIPHLSYTINGKDWENNVLILHWQNINTQRPLYKREVDIIHHGRSIKNQIDYIIGIIKFNLIDFKHKTATQIYNFIHKK